MTVLSACAESPGGPGSPALDAESAERLGAVVDDLESRIMPTLGTRGDLRGLPDQLGELQERMAVAPEPELLELVALTRATVQLLHAGPGPLSGDPDLAVIDFTLSVVHDEVLAPTP